NVTLRPAVDVAGVAVNACSLLAVSSGADPHPSHVLPSTINTASSITRVFAMVTLPRWGWTRGGALRVVRVGHRLDLCPPARAATIFTARSDQPGRGRLRRAQRRRRARRPISNNNPKGSQARGAPPPLASQRQPPPATYP